MTSYAGQAMSNFHPQRSPSRERTREEHLRWDLAYPEHGEMVVDGLTNEDAEAFLAAIADA